MLTYKELKQYILATTDIFVRKDTIVFKTKEKEVGRLTYINKGVKNASKSKKSFWKKAIKNLK
jgi:hypothetical protein